ncbi:MAG: hypothetical protein OEP95_01350, partial [Myxococcales bacterium]|nr:hypothetical protein [Myxococcales bacterium]
MSVSIRLQRGIARGLLVVLLAGTGCALWRTPEGPQADPSYPIEVAEGPAIVDFHIRAASFYGRLAYRRFNVI